MPSRAGDLLLPPVATRCEGVGVLSFSGPLIFFGEKYEKLDVQLDSYFFGRTFNGHGDGLS